MRALVAVVTMVAMLSAVCGAWAQEKLPAAEILRGWIQEMKTAPRGPFERIRWFCSDGTIHPPKPYPCGERGGGIQHGEWNDRVKLLRANGYYIANIFADIKAEQFLQQPQYPEILKQMILEQFLITADDGWILRRARYYRGAFQVEDETESGRQLLLALVAETEWRTDRYLLLREAARYFPHGRKGSPISAMRQISTNIAEKDPGFETLRTKIHVQPDVQDARRVRSYAVEKGDASLEAEYEDLARTIEKVFQRHDVSEDVRALTIRIKDRALNQELQQNTQRLKPEVDPAQRFIAAAGLMAVLRENFRRPWSAGLALELLDTSLALEEELFQSGNELMQRQNQATRRQRLSWLVAGADAVYGMGLISPRQWHSLRQTLTSLVQDSPSLALYKADLDYAVRVPEWAESSLRFPFSEAVAKMTTLEPEAQRYIHDRLRGSLLLLYAAVVDSLMADANQMLGVRHHLFGETVAVGLRGLNPGMARGVLKRAPPDMDMQHLDRNAIYVLPATTAELPPVAGILTTGRGNALSHVQLLARNLGIPNVAVNKSLLPDIHHYEGQTVVLAVSPRGVVQLVADDPRWDAVFGSRTMAEDVIIQPDLVKLNLNERGFFPLHDLRAADAGRIVGPKAANLGELKRHFPKAVTEGVAIPFGHFRALLDQPMGPGGPSAMEWMVEQYARIRSLKSDPAAQDQAVQAFLPRIRDWILQAEPGDEFRGRLRVAMEKAFGPDGTYGVFVRSDTNVEDLPGFTGAGLNLTVPNVVGVDNVLAAISRVWASPFTERAYLWRQAHMDQPQHVYVSILLLKSVPVEKSGVMISADLDSGDRNWLSIAVNEGVGGAVSGQSSEELRVNLQSGRVRLLSHALEPVKNILLPEGGMAKVAASGTAAVLTDPEIEQLIAFSRMLPQQFPTIQNAEGRGVPADVEFGFHQGQLVLFQIRPFLESTRARKNRYLIELDEPFSREQLRIVDLDEVPKGVES